MWIIVRLLRFLGFLAVFLTGYVVFSELVGRLIERGRTISEQNQKTGV